MFDVLQQYLDDSDYPGSLGVYLGSDSRGAEYVGACNSETRLLDNRGETRNHEYCYSYKNMYSFQVYVLFVFTPRILENKIPRLIIPTSRLPAAAAATMAESVPGQIYIRLHVTDAY